MALDHAANAPAVWRATVAHVSRSSSGTGAQLLDELAELAVLLLPLCGVGLAGLAAGCDDAAAALGRCPLVDGLAGARGGVGPGLAEPGQT